MGAARMSGRNDRMPRLSADRSKVLDKSPAGERFGGANGNGRTATGGRHPADGAVAVIDVGRPTAAVLYISIPGTHKQFDHVIADVLASVRPL